MKNLTGSKHKLDKAEESNSKRRKSNKESCSGDGKCLSSNSPYYKLKDVDCIYGCVPQKCPNYVVCREILPQRVLDANQDTYINCAIGFNVRLTILDQVSDCPKCKHKVNHLVRLPHCSHLMCPACVRGISYCGGNTFGDDYHVPETEDDEDKLRRKSGMVSKSEEKKYNEGFYEIEEDDDDDDDYIKLKKDLIQSF